MSRQVGNIAHILAYFLIQFSCSLTILRTLFILVKLAFIVTLTGPWLRLSNNLPLGYASLQLLWTNVVESSGGFLAKKL